MNGPFLRACVRLFARARVCVCVCKGYIFTSVNRSVDPRVTVALMINLFILFTVTG